MLISILGEGRHYGEWWGQGINREYGLKEKRFSLFDVNRWKQEELPEGLYTVPVFDHNAYMDDPVTTALDYMDRMKREGSLASPGFMNPEGVVLFHNPSRTGFKKTYEYDEFGKWIENQERKNGG